MISSYGVPFATENIHSYCSNLIGYRHLNICYI